MIVRMVQEEALPNCRYRFFTKDETLCVCNGVVRYPNHVNKLPLEYRDGTVRALVYDPSSGANRRERAAFKFHENDEEVGMAFLTIQRDRPGWFQAYSGYQIIYRDRVCMLYEVAFYKEGLYLCFYEGNRLLGITEKDLIVDASLDTYTMYLEDEADFPIFSLAMLHCDTVRFERHAGEYTRARRNHGYAKTIQKDLIKKYDPDFIPRIIARDNA